MVVGRSRCAPIGVGRGESRYAVGFSRLRGLGDA